MCFPLRLYDFASSVLKLSIIFEAKAGVIVMHQLAKGMVCSCCPMYRGGFFLASLQLLEKKAAVCISVMVQKHSETQGRFC